MNLRSLRAGVIVLATMLAGGSAGAWLVGTAWAGGRASYRQVEVFARVLGLIEERHLSGIGGGELLQKSLLSMVGALDPHSQWLPPDAFREHSDRADGRVGGIGIEVDYQGDRVLVERIVPGSPGDLAGIREGDELVQINGEPVKNLDTARASLGGELGSVVRLGTLREGVEHIHQVVRDTYIDIRVRSEREGPIGYIRIDQFSRGTAERAALLLAQLEEAGPMQALLIDLRQNGGGLLDEGARFVDLFQSEGTIVETRDRDGKALDRIEAHPDASDRRLPLVILVDSNTASAAELVAGALRLGADARIVGEKTWGKGTAQHVFRFEDGSALKLTVARYHLGDGSSFPDREGLTPDLKVSRGVRLDPRMELALKEARRAAPGDAALVKAIEGLSNSQAQRTLPIPRTGDLNERRKSDPQLEAAWKVALAPN